MGTIADVKSRWSERIKKQMTVEQILVEEEKERWKQLIRGIILLVFGMLTFVLLYNPDSEKNGNLEAFYATLISATTVGYGDISPSSNWAKLLSAFVLPIVTTAFSSLFGTNVDDGKTKTVE